MNIFGSSIFIRCNVTPVGMDPRYRKCIYRCSNSGGPAERSCPYRCCQYQGHQKRCLCSSCFDFEYGENLIKNDMAGVQVRRSEIKLLTKSKNADFGCQSKTRNRYRTYRTYPTYISYVISILFSLKMTYFDHLNKCDK